MAPRTKYTNNLRQFMDKAGWSKADLARKSSVTEKTITKMINFEKTTRLVKIKVAKAFKIDAKKIFLYDEEL